MPTREQADAVKGDGPQPGKRRTARVVLIEQHYKDREAEFTWDSERVDRLCAALQMTPYELGAYLRVPLPQFHSFYLSSRFSKTLELHFTLMERTVIPSSTPPVFPPL